MFNVCYLLKILRVCWFFNKWCDPYTGFTDICTEALELINLVIYSCYPVEQECFYINTHAPVHNKLHILQGKISVVSLHRFYTGRPIPQLAPSETFFSCLFIDTTFLQSKCGLTFTVCVISRVPLTSWVSVSSHNECHVLIGMSENISSVSFPRWRSAKSLAISLRTSESNTLSIISSCSWVMLPSLPLMNTLSIVSWISNFSKTNQLLIPKLICTCMVWKLMFFRLSSDIKEYTKDLKNTIKI